jgi:hypothetical protein
MEVRRASEASLDPLVAVLGQRHWTVTVKNDASWSRRQRDGLAR